MACELRSTKLFKKNKDNIDFAHEPAFWVGQLISTPDITWGEGAVLEGWDLESPAVMVTQVSGGLC